MFCRKCGKEIPDDSVFCPKCGAATESEASPKEELTDTPEQREQIQDKPMRCEVCFRQLTTKLEKCPNCDTPNPFYDGEKDEDSVSIISEINQKIKNNPTEMKRKSRKKTLSKLLIIAAALAAVVAAALIVFIPQAGIGFEYELVDNDHYAITKYTGSGTDVTVPDTIWFKPVTSIATSISGNASPTETGKPGVKRVKLGKNISVIGMDAFKGYTSLEELDCSAVEIKNGKELLINDFAFQNCTNLKKITFPHSGISIGRSAFSKCSSLEDIITAEQHILFTSEDENYRATIGTFENNSYIGENAFLGCTSLKNLSLINTRVDSSAFMDCTGIIELSMTAGELGDITPAEMIPQDNTGESLREAALKAAQLRAQGLNPSSKAFKGCTGLKTATLNFLEKKPIPNETFYGCTALTSVFGANISAIGDNAFGECSSLSEVEFETFPSDISGTAFNGCTKLERDGGLGTRHEFAATNIVGMSEAEAIKKLGNYRIFDNYGFDWYLFEDKGISFGVGQGTHRMTLYEGAYVASGYGEIDNVQIGMTVGEIFRYIGRQTIYMSEMDNNLYFFSYQCGDITFDFMIYSSTHGFPDDNSIVSYCWVNDGYYD